MISYIFELLFFIFSSLPPPPPFPPHFSPPPFFLFLLLVSFFQVVFAKFSNTDSFFLKSDIIMFISNNYLIFFQDVTRLFFPYIDSNPLDSRLFICLSVLSLCLWDFSPQTSNCQQSEFLYLCTVSNLIASNEILLNISKVRCFFHVNCPWIILVDSINENYSQFNFTQNKISSYLSSLRALKHFIQT